MSTPKLEGSPALKTEVMFEGVRYTYSLGAAAAHALPKEEPYRCNPEEPKPTG